MDSESASYMDYKDKVCVRANIITLLRACINVVAGAVALSFDAKSRDIMAKFGMYYLSGGYLPGGNYPQLLFIFPLKRSGKFARFLFAHPGLAVKN